MNHLIIAKIKILIDDNVADVNLGNDFKSSISRNYRETDFIRLTIYYEPLFLWSSLLVLILNIDDIFDGGLSVNPQFIVCSGLEQNNQNFIRSCIILPI